MQLPQFSASMLANTDSTILLCRTQTQTAATSFQHGGLPQRQSCCSLVTHHGLGSRSMREEASSMEGYHNASAASNASTLRWPASTLPTVATSGTKFSECINTSVACIYFSNRGNKQREIQRAHTRETCAPCDSDVTYVVLPAEATSTRLPPAPGQELH